MIVDGKQIAEGVYARLPKKDLRLGILVGQTNPAIESFVKIKARAAEHLGVMLERVALKEGALTEDAIAAVEELAARCHGIIVQLPLPLSIDTDRVLAAIPGEKDVDGISARPRVVPPVAEAVREILNVHAIDPKGKKAVVVGAGRLVGAPTAKMLTELGADVMILERGDSLDALKSADIVILGAGKPALVRPEHLKKGVVLIDAGTSDSTNDAGEKKIAGDADPSCADVASLFTPVPGGVGPIAVAMIFKNLVELATT